MSSRKGYKGYVYEQLRKRESEPRTYISKKYIKRVKEDTIVSQQIIEVTKDINDETDRVIKFIDELKNMDFSKGGNYIRVDKTQYEELKAENDRLKRKADTLEKRSTRDERRTNNPYLEKQLEDAKNKIRDKDDEIFNLEQEIQDLKDKLEEQKMQPVPNTDQLEKRIEEYRKKFFDQKKATNDIKRDNLKLKQDLNDALDKNKELGLMKGKNNNLDEEEINEDFKQELMYEYDLLNHLKGELDTLISEVEGVEEKVDVQEDEFEEEEEQVVDADYFQEEVQLVQVFLFKILNQDLIINIFLTFYNIIFSIFFQFFIMYHPNIYYTYSKRQ